MIGNTKQYFILPDIHDKHPANGRLDRKTYHPALKAVWKIAEKYKPYGLVFLGDTSDMESLSYFDKDKRKKMEGQRYYKDIRSMNHLLDITDKIFKDAKEKIYFVGNHEYRVELYAQYNAEMAHDSEDENSEGGIDYIRDTKLKERGYEVIPFNQTKMIGKACFLHGIYTDTNHAAKMSRIYPKTIFYGHVHDIQTHSFVSPIDHKETRIAESLGCLCSLNPEWLKNKPNKWINAFGILSVKDNGNFQMSRYIIINGEAIVDGIVYKG